MKLGDFDVTTKCGWFGGASDRRAEDVRKFGLVFLELLLTPDDYVSAAIAKFMGNGTWEPPAHLTCHAQLWDLLDKMLRSGPEGWATTASLRAHPLFAGVNWRRVDACGAAGVPELLLKHL